MKIKKIFYFPTLLSFILLTALTNCSQEKESIEVFQRPSVSLDLAEILKKGKLTVLAENSSTSFFMYRGKKMGFEYELLKEFAQELGVTLEIKIVDNLDNLIHMLNNGEGDIIACNYVITRERNKLIGFSVPFMRTPQVLIQRKPYGWQKMKPEKMNPLLIRDISLLAKKKILVWENSNHFERLSHLQDEIGDTILIEKENGLLGSEEMIEMVSEGLIDYTVAEENVARINKRFYENIDYQTYLSVRQKIAFGLRKSSTLLNARLDKWLNQFMAKKTFKYLKTKYYDLKILPLNNDTNKINFKSGQLSPYDASFKRVASKYQWNWLLLASVAFHESRFNPNARGFGGAYGIMQFMPATGPKYGVSPNSTVDQQILGGMKLLNSLYTLWKQIPDKEQRVKFTLASYNAGKGHIDDAQKLAKKYGLNPLIWDNNVEKMMLNLSKREYYRDKVVKSGALRGARTCNYVREIYGRYIEWASVYK